jgi:hypothetical protein
MDLETAQRGVDVSTKLSFTPCANNNINMKLKFTPTDQNHNPESNHHRSLTAQISDAHMSAFIDVVVDKRPSILARHTNKSTSMGCAKKRFLERILLEKQAKKKKITFLESAGLLHATSSPLVSAGPLLGEF